MHIIPLFGCNKERVNKCYTESAKRKFGRIRVCMEVSISETEENGGTQTCAVFGSRKGETLQNRINEALVGCCRRTEIMRQRKRKECKVQGVKLHGPQQRVHKVRCVDLIKGRI